MLRLPYGRLFSATLPAVIIAGTGKPFGRYWTATFLADISDGIRMAAFPLLALVLTSTPIAVAVVTAIQALPWLLLGPGVGVLVDRVDLRRLMAVVDVARVLVTGALALAVMAGTASLTMLYAAAFLSGVGSMIRDTAASTALPRLVPDRQLDVANGRLVAGSLVGGELAGPAAGGALFGLAAALPLATNAASLALAVLLICTLPDVFAPLPPEQDSSGSTVLRTLCGEIYTGMAWLWRDRQLRRLTAATSLVFIADGAFLGVLVLYVTEILHEPPGIYGILLGVGAIGGILGGLTCARLARRFGSAGVLVTTVVAMAAAQLIVGFTSDTLAAAAAMTVSSAAFAVLNVIARTLRQRRSPSALLGRVTAGYLTVIRGAEACGALLGGVIATAGGIRAPIFAGVPMLLMGAALLRRPT